MGLNIPDPATQTATIARLKERPGKNESQVVSLPCLVCTAQKAKLMGSWPVLNLRQTFICRDIQIEVFFWKVHPSKIFQGLDFPSVSCSTFV